MLTYNQEQNIIDYLLEKRLSLDVASEVYDHMTQQTIDFMQNEQLNFEEAWLKTKRIWLDDLSISYSPWYSLDDISVLMKKIYKRQNREVFKTIILKAFGVTLLHFMALWSLPREGVLYFMIAFNLFLLSLIILSLKNLMKLHKIQKQFQNNKILSIGNPFVGIYSLPSGIVFLLNIQYWYSAYDLKFQLMDISAGFTLKALLAGVVFLLYYIVILFILSFRKKYAKVLEKLTPFLHKIQSFK